ncbi:Actin/actin-like protein [Schizopora paradoxa]|uniref:Actin/actin-like protein n=1 Tax=Schizopora paradoxa TaxID=27342 RepID=A0A0H2S2Y6_9AGAM|nr:Actin/actin-like protein [Schizopora paradoxa]
MQTDHPPIVIDVGSAFTKFGYAGEDAPRDIIPSIVGHYPQQHLALFSSLGDQVFVGEEAFARRGVLKLRYPVRDGIISNWWALEKMLSHIFTALGVRPADHPILLSEFPAPSDSDADVKERNENRERTAQLLYEVFGVPAVYWAPQPVLVLHAHSRSTTGVVLDIGHHVARAVAVHDGCVVNLQKQDFAGEALLDYMAWLLGEERGVAFSTSADRKFLQGIMEKRCYVASDFQDEMRKACETTGAFEETHETPFDEAFVIGSERFRVPEALFQPSLAKHEGRGIHQMIKRAISAFPSNLQARLYGNIVLSGGPTLYPGLPERLREELSLLAPAGTSVDVFASDDRQYSTWLGGSLLARQESFQEKWVTKMEYEEYGPAVLHRKCP